jgi:hypothetical protein
MLHNCVKVIKLLAGERPSASNFTVSNFDYFSLNNDELRLAFISLVFAMHVDRLMFIGVEEYDQPEIFV